MYDYIIVGAGSAGCTLAHRLSEDPSCSVLLLEAGPVDRSPFIHMPAGVGELLKGTRYNWAFNTSAQSGLSDRQLFWPRGKGLGGSSSINGLIYIRGHAKDYDHWRGLGNEGWSYDEVLPYFKKSMHQTRGKDAFHGVGGPLRVQDGNSSLPTHAMFIDAAIEAGYPYSPDFNGAKQEGVGPIQVTMTGNRRCSAADAFLRPAKHRDNLTIQTGAHLLRVLFDGLEATGVEYQQRSKTRQVTARREIILAAGAIQSPQLLMLSGVGDPDELAAHNIPCVRALPGVGKNLQDHLDVMVQYHCTDPTLSLSRYTKPLQMLGVGIRYLFTGTGPAAECTVQAGGFIKTSPELDLPDIGLHFVPVFMRDHGRQNIAGTGIGLHVCQLRPRSRGSISLHSDNPFDAPSIDANYLAENEDLRVMTEGVRSARKIFESGVLSKVLGEEFEGSRGRESDDEIAEYIRSTAETVYHPVGTCKMGNDPLAVVDHKLCVHGIERLRVVDASIMPTLVGGNTNAPTIMIAEKAADLIKAESSA